MLNLTLFHNLTEDEPAPDFDIVLHHLINPMEQMINHLLPKNSVSLQDSENNPVLFKNETTIGVEITKFLVDSGVRTV